MLCTEKARELFPDVETTVQNIFLVSYDDDLSQFVRKLINFPDLTGKIYGLSLIVMSLRCSTALLGDGCRFRALMRG